MPWNIVTFHKIILATPIQNFTQQTFALQHCIRKKSLNDYHIIDLANNWCIEPLGCAQRKQQCSMQSDPYRIPASVDVLIALSGRIYPTLEPTSCYLRFESEQKLTEMCLKKVTRETEDGIESWHKMWKPVLYCGKYFA